MECPNSVQIGRWEREENPDGPRGKTSSGYWKILQFTGCYMKNADIVSRIRNRELTLLVGYRRTGSQICEGCFHNPSVTLTQGRLFRIT